MKKSCVLFAMLLFAVVSVPAASVMINEIMFHPGSGKPGEAGYIAEDTRKEFIELYNAGDVSVNLNGWRFVKGVQFTFPDATIPAHGYLVVASDADVARFKASYQANYPAVMTAALLGGWTGVLGDNGDSIELADNQGKTVDSVTYCTEGDWALRREGEVYPGQPGWWRGWQWISGADAGGKSLELVNTAMPNKHGQNWAASISDGGTPGGPNSTAAAFSAPFILDVKHSPAIPQSTNAVTIKARILSQTGSNITVTVFHRLDGAASFETTPMFDDGQHDDGESSDGVYAAILPALADQSVVEFYVQATDAGGKIRTWPGSTDARATQGANAYYQVDNTLYSGSQPIYRLILSKAEWSAWLNLMDTVSGGQYSDPAMNATLITKDGVGTEIRYLTSIRNRGAGTRAAHPHNLHVSIPNDHLWHNWPSLSLNTRTVHAQVAGNAINVMAGLPNHYGAPVQVRINGANLAHQTPSGSTDSFQFGSYYSFQAYNNEWLRVHYPGDAGGNLYKGVWNFDGHSLKHSANLDYLGEDLASYRLAYSTNGPTSSSGPYSKQNNVSADDWSDLINLCRVLTQAPDSNFVEQASQIVDVDEWLNYFAVTTLMGNRETTFGTGTGDDYSMYRSGATQKFSILPHDMDTVMGQGDTSPDYTRSVFEACGIPAVNRLLKNPAIAPRYYAILKHQSDTTFAADQLNPLLDQVLGGWVPETYANSMKDFAARRRAGVLAQIPNRINITSDLAVSGGYPRTTAKTSALSGTADAVKTRSVRVNGAPAVWTAWTASWTISSIDLQPGINRVLVQTFDEQGLEFDQATIPIWRDIGSVKTVNGGSILTDTQWTAANGPYNIAGSLTIARGATLSIEAGTSVYLASGVNLEVADGGRIIASGSAIRPISFVSPPGAGTSWGGIVINGSSGSVETRLSHVYFEGNNTTCIEVAGGTLYLDHALFGTTTHQYVALDGASFVLTDCYFPSSTASFELLHGTKGIKTGGRGIVSNCFFGATTGYNDIMDFTGGNRPNQPVIQYYNNVFIGASDDILDLDGTDAWIEGNIFLHIHKNGSPDSSSAISGGSDSGNVSDITIIGNIIYDCDQAATAKQGNFYTMIGNTIVRQTHEGGLDTEGAVINLADDGTTEGAGMYLEGNIIYDAEKLVRNYSAAHVTFTNNLMPYAWDGPGGGNSTKDPLFRHVPAMSETVFTNWAQAQIMREWLGLRPGSPALGAGASGGDKGGVRPLGAGIAGVPDEVTTNRSATLAVGPIVRNLGVNVPGFPNGSGFTHYQWRLDNGPWSAEMPSSSPIQLENLQDGPHSVSVLGRNDAGTWQNDELLGTNAQVSISKTWTVASAIPGRVRLNEILASNNLTILEDGSRSDAVELANDGGAAADLSGMMLTSNPTNAVRYVFPSGIALDPGKYLVLAADRLTNAPGMHLGFGLNRAGDALYLLNRDGTIADSVVFGLQQPGLSIGRLNSGDWGLTIPTLGYANQVQPVADPSVLKINEWLADSTVMASSDFIELYNPSPLPAPLGGLFLVNSAMIQPGWIPLPPLSYIAGRGFALFRADGQSDNGMSSLGFTLPHEAGSIGLFAPDFSRIDTVFYASQTTDVSQGRSPDGSSTIAYLNPPTPGYDNPGSSVDTNVVTFVLPLIAETNVWKYNQTDIPASGWINPQYTGDASWPSGAALLYVESSSKPWPKNTPLTLGRMTYYFRSHFNVSTNLAGATLNLSAIIDDGAVFYLNGKELTRLHMPSGTVTYDTKADDHESALEGPYALSAADLLMGDNVIAVEVHQSGISSSDIVFGMSLEAAVSVTNTITNIVASAAAINEVMAHNTGLTNLSGTAADWIELANAGNKPVNLGGMSLTDDPALPRKWMFPADAMLPAQSFLVVYCSTETNLTGLNAGFNLKSEGGGVYLFNAADGRLVDSVVYGLQPANYSIGRIDGAWHLASPTPGAANQSAAPGNATAIRINEWMASPANGSDWFELFNSGAAPADVSGFLLTDDLAKTDVPRLPALSFMGVGAFAFQKYVADSAPDKGANHVNFKLSSGGDSIYLLDAENRLIDQVSFGVQQIGISEGRYPDGGILITNFPNAESPGASNRLVQVVADSDGDGMPDAWESAHGLDPADRTDAAIDSDGDGLSNLEEYIAGSDPKNPADALRLEAVIRAGSVSLNFMAVAGRSYAVEYCDKLSAGAWKTLASLPVQTVSGLTTVSDPNIVAERFYRLVLMR